MQQLVNLSAFLVCLALTGCGWMGEREPEASAGVSYSVTSPGVTEPVWLAASRPGLSVVGKDFLFVGPMSVNRSGEVQDYLWFAVGTTIDRRITGTDEPDLNTVVLTIDGTPMTFDLIPWDEESRPVPFELSIDSYASYAARITSSQIRQLANAQVLDAYVTDADSRSPTYSVVVGEPQAWNSF